MMEPKDFYFQLIRGAETYFLITPKKYYDTEGCLSDESGVADGVVPQGFSESTESTYEFVGNCDTGRELLLAAGMEEIDFGFHNRVEPMETTDEEEDYHEEDDEEHDIEEDEDENEVENNNPPPEKFIAKRVRLDDDLDALLNEKEDAEAPATPGDYSNMSSDKLLRHLTMMLKCESFEEAAKIRDELNGRGVPIES